jgi:predicted DNA-binding transcriptional regulator AlpA
MSKLSLVDSKVSEIIDILLLHPESEAPPHNYRELGEHLARFKLQNSQDSLGAMRSMINAFEGNREVEEDYKFFDESGGEPDNEEFWDGEPEETGGSYSDDERFFNEFGEPLDDEAEDLSAHYNQKYYKEHENSSSCSHSTLTPVENNVVLGLILQIKKNTGGYNKEFLTTMQDTLQLVGFSTPQIWEVMTQHLNPESQRFYSPEIQEALARELSSAKYN